MALSLDPAVPIARGLRRAARQQLAEAIERIDVLATADATTGDVDVERQVHEIRKRCKEVRAIARLVEPSEGRRARDVERSVRDAARRLASSRDAAAIGHTLDGLAAGRGSDEVAAVRTVAALLAADGDRRPLPAELGTARGELHRARRGVKRWSLDDGEDAVQLGLRTTLRRARRCWLAAQGLDAEPMHAWRTVNKRWWYQARLLQPAAPDVFDPMVARLDAVGELLGDVHDLDVLIERLDALAGAADDADDLQSVGALAVRRRQELAVMAVRRAEPLFVERPGRAARRMIGHWRLAAEHGVDPGAPSESERPAAPIERERKFLVGSAPSDGAAGSHLRQGYLAVDGTTSVRIRSVDGVDATLTVKVGGGTTRHEFERSIEPAVFDELWPLTAGRRIDKVRHVAPLGAHTVEIDVFADELDGLVVAEVEFDSDEATNGFVPPDWFGREVSDDARYTNARLAIDGLPA